MKSKKKHRYHNITLVSKLTLPFSPLKRKKIQYKSIGSNEHISTQKKKKVIVSSNANKKKVFDFCLKPS